MVCEKCEGKLAKIATPDPWKAGPARKINENKALTSAKDRYNPIGKTLPPCR